MFLGFDRVLTYKNDYDYVAYVMLCVLHDKEEGPIASDGITAPPPPPPPPPPSPQPVPQGKDSGLSSTQPTGPQHRSHAHLSTPIREIPRRRYTHSPSAANTAATSRLQVSRPLDIAHRNRVARNQNSRR